jgi:hypothetical protein
MTSLRVGSTTYRPHRCIQTKGKAYLAYFESELPSDVDPYLLRKDGYTRIRAGFRYTVKELKDGTFIILRDIEKVDCQIAPKPKEKGEGLGYQPAAFNYNTISHHCDQQYVDEETYE